jgi:hypothetical protein
MPPPPAQKSANFVTQTAVSRQFQRDIVRRTYLKRLKPPANSSSVIRYKYCFLLLDHRGFLPESPHIQTGWKISRKFRSPE